MTHEIAADVWTGGVLPEAVTNLKPNDLTDQTIGETVHPGDFVKDPVADGDGRWVFNEWTPAELEVGAGKNEFVGEWLYEAPVKHAFTPPLAVYGQYQPQNGHANQNNS